MKRLSLILVFIITPVIWILFLEKGNTFKKEPAAPLQELKDIRIDTAGSGNRLWRLEAARALIDSNDIAMLYELKFISDKKGIEITAPYGRYDLQKGLAEIKGGVLIKLSDGSEARIDSLRIDGDIIKSEEPVVIKKGNMILKGNGMISRSDTGELKILRDVRLEIR